MSRTILTGSVILGVFALQSVPSHAAATQISVASDPSARYQLLSLSKLPNGNLQVLTRRDGRSGTSFARREVNCSAMTFRYLGEGDTLKQAQRNTPNRGRMSEAFRDSISGEVSRFACRRSRR